MKTTNPYSMLDAGHDAWREGYADCQRDMQRAGGDVEKQEEKSGPVCSVCNDTHVMPFSGRLGAPCTHCPVPCGRCAADNAKAYCATTPCPCECHVAKCEVVSSGMRGGKPHEEKSGPITFTDANGIERALTVTPSFGPGHQYATPDDLTRAGFVKREAREDLRRSV